MLRLELTLLVPVSVSATPETTNWAHHMAAPSTLRVSTQFPTISARRLIFLFLCLAVANGTLTLRERDSTDQLIGKIDDVIAVTVALSNSQMKWSEACEKLEKYSGTQEIE